jgi:SAM-dependent methyltransferase
MANLTEKTHWDGVHIGESQRLFRSGESARATAVKALKKLLGAKFLQRISGYDDYLLWEVLLPKYVPRLNGANAVEIGSAPGEYIVQFSKNHDCVPHGVEYSEIGVEVNRRVFTKHGFDPDNVIHADFFSDDFINQYKEHFDVVVSKGFIEHFEDVPAVIDRHTRILKPGGYLIVTVPNLRNGNKALAQAFDETAIPRHNLKIMRKDVYRSIFDRKDLQQLFCGYYGTFSFYLFTAGHQKVQRHMLKAAYKVQPILNVLFRTMLGPKGAEGPMFSPFLIYVGRKV